MPNSQIIVLDQVKSLKKGEKGIKGYFKKRNQVSTMNKEFS